MTLERFKNILSLFPSSVGRENTAQNLNRLGSDLMAFRSRIGGLYYFNFDPLILMKALAAVEETVGNGEKS